MHIDKSEDRHIGVDRFCRILASAVEVSGRTRREISTRTSIHKDTLRRILVGDRTPTLAEATAVLEACGCPAKAILCLCIHEKHDCVEEWHEAPILQFLDTFVGELPGAMGRVLGPKIGDVRPRWAKGSAHRVARLIADHIDDLDRRDQLLTGALEDSDA